MSKGNINVSVENIFPLIKKFLYSDHEIFLRELISNGTDATTKLKHLISIGEAKTELGDAKIEISIDKDAKTLTIKDQGIGMTMDEVEKYINQIAFSGAEEFLEKYKDDKNETGVIGHFGLGFYSAFMVADKVEIFTKSFKDEPAAHWTCDGSPEYTLVEHDKSDRGTEIVLHIAEDSTEFLEEGKIRGLLTKYNRFNQVPIKFGTKKINDPDFTPKTTKDEDGKEVTEPHKQIEVDDIINNTEPAWTKKPADLEDEDYKNFYRELYPMQFEESLFHIHLNVDYPFNLTGILYFPKLTQNLDMQKDKIQLYQNQVFVTDNVEGIVPDFLQMLKGVIDSPDIPLNVSRSYLQADGAVKKISGYITKKVADKLSSLFKNNREDFEQKWNDIKVIIEYGMLSEEKFFSKAKKFALYPTVDDKFFTFDELVEKTKDAQTDKDGNHIVLYAANKDAQHSYIEDAKAKGYEVLLLDSPIVSHLMQKLEMESGDAKVQFKRVDADHIDNLIKKDDTVISKLSDEEKEQLKPVIEGAVNNTSYTVQLEAMDSSASPFIITVPEFMRRMKEMSATGGGMMGMGNMPEMYNLVVNTNHELVSEILNADEDKQKQLVTQAFDLAKLSQNLLHGEELTNFIKRSYELIK
ncbi:molecular chaperone HtpG [Tenacibaculum sp. Mcav3-52]|uniref:Chaperone protein HtpG n=1 Tax=Tenacibaculum mesophilum TaxID=104268 RepID=A0AAE9MNF6_9FLAO|nr:MULTISPECIES: molecular chaperone HtpG [Tenacibaculum]GFD92747.1 chaperone protein HtpG [Alteromonas sp. KUL154]GFE00766.1 chaperone protein HtpG [Alteromonas sp. KUL156]KAF9658094.1 molecular chaperone HtpG [Tenacibaculum mesophilum]MCG7502801.1 molecular chaperone HtpG [Tenacibaculum sp. Mcav3-52]UTD14665.1 molecular chaperone HtpG [Tenacibaculum mesophilum]